MKTPAERLELASAQLAKAQVAAFEPVDWLEVAVFSFYALENATCAAADKLGVEWTRTHPSKVHAAQELHQVHGLPDASQLLVDLNELRKSESYGEIRPPLDRTAEDIVADVEDFIVRVEEQLGDEE